ncbi:MAG: PQQ-binding-like beta-propeller repeat protein [Planctomycetota bacterium]
MTPILSSNTAWMLLLLFLACDASWCRAQQTVLLGGKDGLAVVQPNGTVTWHMDWGGIHDVHVTPDGLILTRQGRSKVVLIDPKKKEVVFTYDAAISPGNAGRKIEIHAAQPLDTERIMVAESGRGRIIEIDRSGKILHEITLKIDHPNPHRDTRLVRRLDHGGYLVAHEGDGVVREYDRDGTVQWEYSIPLFGKEPARGHGPEAFGNAVFSAIRLPNGNTLIGTGNGHSVLEVTPNKEIVWQIHQNDLPGIQLAWVTTLEQLDNGNVLIGNCHAGPGQPILIELDRSTNRVVWQLDGHEAFGNNVSNSVIYPAAS